MSYQKITIVGNVGNDFVQQQVNNRNVLNGSVAVAKSWTDKQGNKHTNTTWFSVSFWGDRDFTNLAKYLTKGTQVLVIGEVSARTYADKSGKMQVQLVLTADEIKLLGSKQNNQQQPTPQASSEQSLNQHLGGHSNDFGEPATF